MDHPDRKPRCTAGLQQPCVSTALYGLYVCHFAVYSRCAPVSLRKEDDLHSPEVHPTGGSRRVFKQVVRLGIGSDKIALSRPAHPRVTQTVSTLELIGGATMLLNFFGLTGILHLMPSHTNRFLSVSTLFDRGSS